MVRRLLFCFAFGAVLFSGCNQMPKECRKYSEKELLENIAFWYDWCVEGFYSNYFRCPHSIDELIIYLHGDYGIMPEQGCDKLFLERHFDDFRTESDDTMYVLYYRGDTLNYNIREPWSDKRLLIDCMGDESLPRWFDHNGDVYYIEGDVKEQLNAQIAELLVRLGYDKKEELLLLGDIFAESDFHDWNSFLSESPARPLFRYDAVSGLSLHPLFQERFSGIDSTYLSGLEEIAAACFSLYHADSLWFPACVPVKKKKGCPTGHPLLMAIY